MKISTKIISLGLILIVILGLIFFKVSTSENTVKIGVIAPLTGPLAYIGEEVRDGLLLAQEEINNKGGINGKLIDLSIEDHVGDPKSTITSFNKLSDFYEPDVVISVASGKGVYPIGEDKRIPILTTVSSASGIPKEGEYIFRFFTNADTDAPAIAEYASRKLGLKTFGILYVNDEFGVDYSKVFEETVSKFGGKVLAKEAVNYQDWDYRTQLLKIKDKNPEAIYVIGIESQIVNALKQMKTFDMLDKVTVLAVGTVATPNGVNELTNLETELYTSAFCLDEIPPEYIGKFMKKYNKFPGFFSTFGYDSINLIANAVEIEGYSREEIKNGLLKTKDFRSTVGKVYSDEYGEMWFDMCPKKVSKEGILNLVSGGYYRLG